MAHQYLSGKVNRSRTILLHIQIQQLQPAVPWTDVPPGFPVSHRVQTVGVDGNHSSSGNRTPTLQVLDNVIGLVC